MTPASSGIPNRRRFVRIFRAPETFVPLWEPCKSQPGEFQICSRRVRMLAHLQFESTERKQIRGRREAKVDVNTSCNIGVQHAIHPPTSTPGRSDPDVNCFPSEIADHSSALCSKCGVRNDFVLKMTGTVLPRTRRSRKSPPGRELDQATAIVAGVVQLPPKKCALDFVMSHPHARS